MNQLDQPSPTEEVPSPGTYLRSYREASGMSVDDVAQALKLTPRQVMAIEADDYERLSGPTFVRGFIRNYARLLRLDPAALMKALDARIGLPAAEFHVPETENVRMPQRAEGATRRWTGAAVLALVMLIVALVLYFDLGNLSRFAPSRDPVAAPAGQAPAGQAPAVPPQPEVVAPAGDDLAPQSVPDAAPSLPTPTEPSSLAPAPAEPDPPSPAEEASAVPLQDPGVHRLVFSFDGESWVEVRDATGRILLSQINAKGTRQKVEGRGPLSLVIGSAGNVRLEDNGQPVDLQPYTKVDVARLKVQ